MLVVTQQIQVGMQPYAPVPDGKLIVAQYDVELLPARKDAEAGAKMVAAL